MLGLLLGLCIALLVDQMDSRIRLDRDMPELRGSPVLGFLPPVGPLGPARFAADPDLNGYRILATHLSFAAGAGKPMSILLCRTNDNEDTLPTALNLAVAMAEAGRTTILVDADTHTPDRDPGLGTDGAPGIADVLRNDATLDRALQPGLVPGLAILTPGTAGGTTSPLVNPTLARRLDDELKAHADCVIYHGPPVLVAAELLQLAAVADGVAYVITEGETRYPELTQAAGMLAGVHANVLGLAIHQAHRNKGRRDGRTDAASARLFRTPGSLLSLWQRPSARSHGALEEIGPPRPMPERGGPGMAKGSNEI
jgi:hypothetical protein